MLPVEPPGTDAALLIDDAWWPRAPRPGKVFRHSVGARAVDLATWLRPRPDDAPLLGWRADVLEAVGWRAFRALPGSESASALVLDLVRTATAGGRAGVRTATAGGEARARTATAGGEARARTATAGESAEAGGARHPLESAGRMVAEDLCVMDVSGPAPVLVAACLTMPNRWLLADKIGRDLLGVHAPVPGYERDIGSASDRLLQGLAEGRVIARGTWNLVDDPALFQPSAHALLEPAEPPAVRTAQTAQTAREAAARLWVRTEHQTLRALPGRAVLFTIRTGREPLAALERRPDRAASLLAVIEAMPDDQHGHKGVSDPGAVTAWLRHCARGRLA